jgi:branched-chain amino acid transport system ATP-binding protein
MKNPAVIDAYLGAYHDTDLGDDAAVNTRASSLRSRPRSKPRPSRNDHK